MNKKTGVLTLTLISSTLAGEISIGSDCFSADFLLGKTRVGCSATVLSDVVAFCFVRPRGGFVASGLPRQ